jgi:hypothetical protein
MAARLARRNAKRGRRFRRGIDSSTIMRVFLDMSRQEKDKRGRKETHGM